MFACASPGNQIDEPEAPDSESSGSPPKTSMPCEDNEDCASEDVCAVADGVCVAAHGHMYRIHLLELQVPSASPDGTQWDDDGSPPDPQCLASIDGGFDYGTPDQRDTYTATWTSDRTTRAKIIGTRSEVLLRCWDDDSDAEGESSPPVNTPILIHCWGDPCGTVPAHVLHDKETWVEANGARLRVEFEAT